MTMLNKILPALVALVILSGCSTVTVEAPGTLMDEVATPVAEPQFNSRAMALFSQANELRLEQPERAIELYSESLTIDNSIEPALFNLARMYFDGNQFDDLASLAENQSATSARVWNLIGLSYRKQGLFQEAKTAYEQALLLDSTHLNSLMNAAVLHDLYLHDLGTALTYYQQYEQALEAQGQTNPELRNWLADLNQRLRGAGQ